jgi:hypothetical protein
MTNWEYKLEINLGSEKRGDDDDPEKAMNEIGADGWELVSVVEVSTKTGGKNLAFFFKRPID